MNTNPGKERAQQHYLHGAELAQQAQYDRAAQEMTTALELDPSLHTSRFQLGLLYLMQAQPERAMATWAPLEDLEDAVALKPFKRGLEALIRDDFAGCIRWLRAGILLNTTNAALNGDMTLVIHKAAAALEGQQPAAKDATNGGTAVHTDFSLYQNGQ